MENNLMIEYEMLEYFRQKIHIKVSALELHIEH